MKQPKKPNECKGSAGGSASTGGAAFASAVAAWCAVKMLLGDGARLPWNLSSSSRIVEIACESDSEVDDLVLRLAPRGNVYLQIKHGLTFGSECRKAIGQLVRQYHTEGFSVTDDRLVIATDFSASGSIRERLKKLVVRLQDASQNVSLHAVAKNDAEREVLKKIIAMVDELWAAKTGVHPADAELRTFFGCMDLFVVDPLEGNDVHAAIESIGRVIDEAKASSAWTLLNQRCLKSAWLRQPFDLPGLWKHLRSEDVAVAPRGFPLTVARAMTRKTLDLLTQARRYSLSTYVCRGEADTFLRHFLGNSERVMLVAGASGRGKSSWSAYHCDASIHGTLDQLQRHLVRGEDLDPADPSLFATFTRLLRSHALGMHAPIANESEIQEWLREEKLLVFLDGLDRTSAAFRGNLSRWFEGTLLDLASSNTKLIVTSRPESIGSVLALLGESGHLYQPIPDRQQYVEMPDFSDEEAQVAARSFGNIELARFRHPSLMAFSAHVRGKSVNIGQLQPHEIIEAYVRRRMQQIEAESGLLPEAISALINGLGQTLADSSDGELDRKKLDALSRDNPVAYEAVRRNNLLTVHQGIGRVEPDEISEHLQGQFIDVERSLSQLNQILERPLKLGALRAAMIRVAVSDIDALHPHMELLLAALSEHRKEALFSLACAVLRTLKEWTDTLALVNRIAPLWPKENFMAVFGFGKEFLEFLSNAHWSAIQKVELLWVLARNESGYDWRQKHWLRPDYAPNYHVTPWRVALTNALDSAGKEGLAFLIPHFGCDDVFSDTDEANLGDLAQGLFVIAAEKQFEDAIAAANECETDVGRLIRSHLAERYPNKFLYHLPHAIRQGNVRDEDVTELLKVVRCRDHDATILLATVRKLHALPNSRHYHREYLSVLSENGDDAAAAELIRQDSLDSDSLQTLNKHTGDVYEQLINTVFARIGTKEIAIGTLLGLQLPKTELDITFLFSQITDLLTRLPGEITTIAQLVELLIYDAYNSFSNPVVLVTLVETILLHCNANANRNIIYGVIGLQRDVPLGTGGARLRNQLTDRLIDMEVDIENARLMAMLIGTRYREKAQAVTWLKSLVHRHSEADVLTKLREFASFDVGAAEVLTELEPSP